MKKIISLLLAMTMIFALCACGASVKNSSAESTEDSIEESTEETAEKSESNTVYVPTDELVVNSSSKEEPSVAAPTTEDYLKINQVVLNEINGKIYAPNIDMKCVFPQNITDSYPTQAFLYFQYLNEKGEITNTIKTIIQQLSYNYGGWSDDISFVVEGDSSLDISEVKTIVFTHYEMMALNGSVVWRGTWDFLNPVVYEVSDLLPENVIEDAKNGKFDGDPIDVEEITIEKRVNDCNISMKIRNNGSNKKDVIKLEYQILDKMGDVILNDGIDVMGLEPGQAGRTNSCRINCLADEIGSVKITKYAYGESHSQTSYTIPKNSRFEFIEPIIIPIEDITVKTLP